MSPSKLAAAAFLCAVIFSVGAPASLFAVDKGNKEAGGESVQCRMIFNLEGWSAFYNTAKGNGTITCDNGQQARVKIRVKGGGVTFGKSKVIGGTGHFTGARNLGELYGSYAQSEAHAGAGKSGDVQAMTKGNVSLALTGTGSGVDIGFAFGKFTIERAK